MDGPATLSVASRFEIHQKVGAGATAVVYKAFDHELQQDVALKVINKSQHDFGSEIRAMARMRQVPHVCPLLDTSSIDGKPAMVLPLAKGTLFDFIKPTAAEDVSIASAHRWMRQLVAAARGVAEAGFVHGDIKPENCLITESGDLLLHDFGNIQPVGHVPQTIRVPGTQFYMAPEMLVRDSFDVAQDVWAIGLTWYAVLFADLPWNKACIHDIDYMRYVRTHALPGPTMDLLSDELVDLLERMLHPTRSSRATLDEVYDFLLEDRPWFRPHTPVHADDLNVPSDIPHPIIHDDASEVDQLADAMTSGCKVTHLGAGAEVQQPYSLYPTYRKESYDSAIDVNSRRSSQYTLNIPPFSVASFSDPVVANLGDFV